jgi:hypothetical protein
MDCAWFATRVLLFVAAIMLCGADPTSAWEESPEALQRDSKKDAARKASPVDPPADHVLLEIVENIPDLSWDVPRTRPTATHQQSHFALVEIPHKYTPSGVIDDHSKTFLLRASAMVALPAGEHRILLRSLGGARLHVDGRIAAVTPFITLGGDAHGKVPEIHEDISENMRPLPIGHHEKLVTITSTGEPPAIVLEALVGRAKSRQELGQLSVSIEREGGTFYLLSPAGGRPIAHTDLGWSEFAESERARLRALNAELRAVAATADERELLSGLLADGFEKRIVPGAKSLPPRSTRQFAISWANHLSPEANKIKHEMEQAARDGDPPFGPCSTRRSLCSYRSHNRSGSRQTLDHQHRPEAQVSKLRISGSPYWPKAISTVAWGIAPGNRNAPHRLAEGHIHRRAADGEHGLRPNGK